MSNTTMRTYYTFNTDSVEFLVTEYAGSVERQYTRRDTTQRVHNTIGYYTDSTYYHYVKDHLGNVCAVVESAKDSLVQGTIYYPSGVPMSHSFGRDVQPYLYNGKEFVEAHGWNTYDYGFRGYYAPIGRFTSIDPLAEQTPWYSPYSYAGNRFVNSIDWMGLGGMTGFSSGYNWVAVDREGVVVDFDLNSIDIGIYEVDDDWDGTYWDLLRYSVIGSQLDRYSASYHKGNNIRGKYNTSGGGYYNNAWGCKVIYGTKPRENAELLEHIFRGDPTIFKDALIDFSKGVINGFMLNYTYNMNIKFGMEMNNIGKMTALMMKGALKGLTYINIGFICCDILANGINPKNASDAVGFAIAEHLSYIALTNGISGLISILGTSTELLLRVGFIIGEVYLLGNYLINVTDTINSTYGGWEWMGEVYGFK